MKDINFLPDVYMKRQARRNRVVREIVLIVSLSLVFIGWWAVGFREVSVLKNESIKLQHEVSMAEKLQLELIQLQKEQGQLEREMKLKNELSQPVQYTQIIAKIGSLLPESVALLGLEMQTKRPKPMTATQAAAKAQRKPARSRSRNQDQKKTQPVIDEISVEFDGLAPDDLHVAEVISRLSDCPLFRGVELRFSREVERDGLIGRKFKLRTIVSLSHEYAKPYVEREMADAY
ncbi:PilN domain-containing protein [Poriferisphaera sp. WC338]|uniref:PilN domain-containing protein n=1 Tax=Poriferisphaera sp. WC338 TaxID=3425129 RepID=UPI003D812ED5